MNTPNLYQQENSIPLMKILDIQEPPEGGLLSTVEGMKVPYKGFPQPHIVYALGTVKKAIKHLVIIHLDYKGLFIFFLFKKYRQKAFDLFNDFCEGAMRYLITPVPEYPQNPHKWCKSARELWRIGQKNYAWKVVCMIWEFDNAYRFRGQFAFKIIDVKALLAQPRKELWRVFHELQDREKNQSMKDKYKMLFKLIYLLYIPRVKREFLGFIRKMDVKKIAPDEEDEVWISLGKSFNFN